jgi:hypothetical protein
MEYRGIGIGFWIQWILVSFITAFVVGPLSPFLGYNLSVEIGGWETLRSLTTDGIYLSLVVFSAIAGLVIGVLEMVLLRVMVAKTEVGAQASVIAAFSIESILTALAFNLTTGSLFVGFIPLCGLSLLVWGIGLAIPLFVPFTWNLKPVCHN